MDWTWYMIGGIVGMCSTFFMLWIAKKLGRIKFEFVK